MFHIILLFRSIMKQSYSNQNKSDNVFIYMYNPSLEPTPMPDIDLPMQSLNCVDTTEINEVNEINHLENLVNEHTNGKY